MFHRPSAFPLAVATLTVALAATFVVAALRREPASTSFFAPAAESYRSDLARIVASFEARDAEAGGDLGRLAAAEEALDAVLALQVPVSERDTHLAVAVALNQIRAGLRGEEGMEAKGRAALEAAKAGAPWLD